MSCAVCGTFVMSILVTCCCGCTPQVEPKVVAASGPASSSRVKGGEKETFITYSGYARDPSAAKYYVDGNYVGQGQQALKAALIGLPDGSSVVLQTENQWGGTGGLMPRVDPYDVLEVQKTADSKHLKVRFEPRRQ